MNKVFRNISLSPDAYVGHVEFDGKVYENRLGPDKYVGHVELDSGKIYGPGINNYLGQVMLDDGKVYRQKPFALDEHLGHVDGNGKFYRQRFGPDEYIGQIEGATSYALSGAAFLLLVWPEVEKEIADAQAKKDAEDGEALREED